MVKGSEDGANIRKSSTRKVDCPFFIRFALDHDGQFLRVADIKNEHNHNCEEGIYQSLLKQRRLDDTSKAEVLNLLQLNCNKKLLKNYVKNKYQKFTTLKDLTNLKFSSTSSSKDELKETIDFLNTFLSSTVEVVVNKEDVLEGLYFQDQYMKDSFKPYPELLLCDATYKLNNLKMPLYLFAVVNGNGEAKVVATFIFSSENTESIRHMTKIFKENNSSWGETVTIFTDKDFKERTVFMEEFDKFKVLLCLFHTLKAFKTSITCESMNISSEQRTTVLELLQKLAYSSNEKEYFLNYDALVDLNFEKVVYYYNKNWHPIRDQWVEGLKKLLDL